MRAWKLSGACAAVALVAMLGLTLGSGASPPADISTPPPRVIAPPRPATLGAGSCSAQACHGGVRPMAILPGVNDNALRDEHTTWATRDRHERAYRVLLGERSKSIARNLAGRAKRAYTPAHEDRRCLACHATPADPAMTPPDDLATIRQDGVGCESCHGPARDWITKHTELGWRSLPAEAKRSFNMAPTLDLADRVRACVGCHVGAGPDPAWAGGEPRDVNHDLIAAGHPRLNFEFGAYLANMPRHWREQGRNLAPDFEARAWAIGQVATMKAALELLAWRAGGSSGAPPASAGQAAPPWPEFAEYGCFSCHFSLRDKSWRNPDPEHRDREQPLGLPVWSSWYAPMVRDFARRDAGPGGDVEARLKELRARMSTPVPARDDVAAQAAAAAKALDAWLEKLRGQAFDPGAVKGLIEAFRLATPPGPTEGVHGWDHATQRYLALVALNQALAAGSSPPGTAPRVDPAARAYLESLLKGLEFPEGFDSPRDYQPGEVK
jgi:hypothetical protein